MPASVVKKNKSAIKRTRQTETKTIRNKSIKSELKTLIKNIETAVSNKSAEDAKTALAKAIIAIDKAAQKGSSIRVQLQGKSQDSQSLSIQRSLLKQLNQ